MKSLRLLNFHRGGRSRMRRVYEHICTIEALVAKITLVAMVTLVFSAGIARLFRNPINWAVDMSTFLFAWSCFLSADVAWRNDKLMSVDVLVNLFPDKVRERIKLINYFAISAFLIFLIIFGFLLSYTTRARTFQGIPGFSYTWVTLSVPVGSLCLLVTTILKGRREL